MINIFTPFKKMLGFDKKQNASKEQEKEDGVINKVANNAKKLSNFANNKLKEAVVEYGVIREKMKDLQQTNYNLALYHLEKGNLPEAIFRLRIIKKFWPNNYEARYQLAYCLILANKFIKAQKVIDELLQDKPDYRDKVEELINSIKNAQSDQDSQNTQQASITNV